MASLNTIWATLNKILAKHVTASPHTDSKYKRRGVMAQIARQKTERSWVLYPAEVRKLKKKILVFG